MGVYVMAEELTEGERLLTALLLPISKAIKNLIECPNCAGLGFSITNADIVFKENWENELLIRLETETCDCKKQAQSILSVIRKYEGTEDTSEDTK